MRPRNLVSIRTHDKLRLLASVYRDREDGKAEFFHFEFSGPAVEHRAPLVIPRSASKAEAQERADQRALEEYKHAGVAHDCSLDLCGDWTDVPPKMGDSKTCRLCNAEAVLRLIPESNAGAFGDGGGALPPRVPAYHAWECTTCGDREAANGPIEN